MAHVAAAAVSEPVAAATAPAEPQVTRTYGNGATSSNLSAESLKPMLESAGLVWVNTDSDKLRAAQDVAAQSVKPARVPRERKALPPADSTPMQQVETAKQ